MVQWVAWLLLGSDYVNMPWIHGDPDHDKVLTVDERINKLQESVDGSTLSLLTHNIIYSKICSIVILPSFPCTVLVKKQKLKIDRCIGKTIKGFSMQNPCRKLEVSYLDHPEKPFKEAKTILKTF